jgi:hypothetical protein
VNNPPFSFNISVECPSELLLKLGPPHIRWLFTSIEESPEYFVCLSNINGMDSNALIMFN